MLNWEGEYYVSIIIGILEWHKVTTDPKCSLTVPLAWLLTWGGMPNPVVQSPPSQMLLNRVRYMLLLSDLVISRPTHPWFTLTHRLFVFHREFIPPLLQKLFYSLQCLVNKVVFITSQRNCILSLLLIIECLMLHRPVPGVSVFEFHLNLHYIILWQSKLLL